MVELITNEPLEFGYRPTLWLLLFYIPSESELIRLELLTYFFCSDFQRLQSTKLGTAGELNFCLILTILLNCSYEQITLPYLNIFSGNVLAFYCQTVLYYVRQYKFTFAFKVVRLLAFDLRLETFCLLDNVATWHFEYYSALHLRNLVLVSYKLN